MPIVIDDLQVEPAPSEPGQRRVGGGDEAAGGNGNGGGKQADAEEFERAFRTQAERAERVWAH